MANYNFRHFIAEWWIAQKMNAMITVHFGDLIRFISDWISSRREPPLAGSGPKPGDGPWLPLFPATVLVVWLSWFLLGVVEQLGEPLMSRDVGSSWSLLM
jgi:hypothetical protein